MPFILHGSSLLWTLPPHPFFGEAVYTLYQGTSCTRTFECLRILTGCNVLNFVYQLDISPVDISFIYNLKLRIGGGLSMLAHSPWLQFVTGLSDSPKTEAKEVVLVKGLWYETSSSPRLPFDLNKSLLFPGLFQLSGTYTPLGRLCFDMPLFYEIIACFDMPF